MTILTFNGHISKGAGLFATQLVVPGTRELPAPIPNWPAQLHPGTLNFKVSANGFPLEFLQHFGTASVKHLDKRSFKPLVELPGALIRNNTLPATAQQPDRGNAQIWKATIVSTLGTSAECWVLRRICSGYSDVLECVSERALRKALNAPADTALAAQLLLEGSWQVPR